jgi:Uncharacterized conserved protein
MTREFELGVDISGPYKFHRDDLDEIAKNRWVRSNWPIVYFLQHSDRRVAYVGESTNSLARIKTHLSTPKKANAFNTISIIASDKFNKSATLDIEAKLIEYLFADGTFEVQNGNYGHINHNYYQQDLYRKLFREIWTKLIEKRIVTKSLSEIENSEVFKYSPFKSLNQDQYASVLEILRRINSETHNHIFVDGSAGTGKTILATYLIKLLVSDLDEIDIDDLNEDELKEIQYLKSYREKLPSPKIGLVVAMTSLRKTLQNVFRKIPGLKPSMVISPSDTFKEKYDLLIVDEAHRLRQFKNISWMGEFRKNNRRLGLDDSGTELDWILANSSQQIFFYDAKQSVKPSDINRAVFNKVRNEPSTTILELKSQMRVQGGNGYISFVSHLLSTTLDRNEVYHSADYEVLHFESLQELYAELEKREMTYGLCRLIAGYSWPWLSKTDKNAIDISIDGVALQWNTTANDWINSSKAFREVGCIHTTQGYDLNYAGIIFGREIDYNKETDTIEVDPNLYFDKYGKVGVRDNDQLKEYILNIYQTIMCRGIRGTFVYACNPNLREYLRRHIQTRVKALPFRILHREDVKPFVNSVPLFDISAAAGTFSDSQLNNQAEWIELPPNITVREGYFVCKVLGESMNRKIPNGSYCLFSRDQGGTRYGKIVLVELADNVDPEFGRYTIKEYTSTKITSEDGWTHSQIILKPVSSQHFDPIVLTEDEAQQLKVIGIFERVLQ